jgi:hypothetical protein
MTTACRQTGEKAFFSLQGESLTPSPLVQGPWGATMGASLSAPFWAGHSTNTVNQTYNRRDSASTSCGRWPSHRCKSIRQCNVADAESRSLMQRCDKTRSW